MMICWIIPLQQPEILAMTAAYSSLWQQISYLSGAGFVDLLDHTTPTVRNSCYDLGKLASIPSVHSVFLGMTAAYPHPWQQISYLSGAGYDDLLDYTTPAAQKPCHDLGKLASIPSVHSVFLGMTAAYSSLWQQISYFSGAGFVDLLDHSTPAARNPWHDCRILQSVATNFILIRGNKFHHHTRQ